MLEQMPCRQQRLRRKILRPQHLSKLSPDGRQGVRRGRGHWPNAAQSTSVNWLAAGRAGV
jgi:hypothetical protein